MRANTQKSFPYPVIRDEFDDYLNETFEIIPSFELSEDSKNAKFLRLGTTPSCAEFCVCNPLKTNGNFI